jgi:hypothetical protein
VALLGVLAVGVWAAFTAFAATPPPAPTISAQPANPTNSTSASFTYTDSATITKFQCAIDNGSFADCGTKRPSSKSYGGLGAGSHTFRVRAVASSGTSGATSYTWVIDRTAPRVSSATRLDPTPTNLASVRWNVVFTEPVTGVAKSNFAVLSLGLTGSVSVTGVTGSGTTYTVTASTGTGTPLGTGLLQLAVSSAGAVKDLAGNSLAGLPVLGQTYTLDKIGPSTPQITAKPASLVASTSASLSFKSVGSGTTGFVCSLDNAAYTSCTSPKAYSSLGQGSHTFRVEATDNAGNASAPASATWVVDTVAPTQPSFSSTPASTVTVTGSSYLAQFAWSSTDPVPGSGVASYKCSLDNGTAVTCTSPKSYTVNLGHHSFSVVAYDTVGNASSPGTYAFDVVQQNGLPFTVNGDAVGLIGPGHGAPINLVFTNPNNVPIVVTDVTAAFAGTSNNTACPVLGNFHFGQQLQVQVTVPANATNVSLQSLGVAQASWPTIAMDSPPANQDGCQHATVNLTYSGNAHS